MKLYKILASRIALVIAAGLIALSSSALDLPTKIVKGKEYYVYKVKKGDTMFSLSRSLGVSADQIRAAMPSSDGVLKAETELLFPVEGSLKTFAHTVEKGETLFGISHKYNVTVEELVGLNPQCEGVIKAGQTINIPVKKGNEGLMSNAERANSQPRQEPETSGIIPTVKNTAEKVADKSEQWAQTAADKTVNVADRVAGAVEKTADKVSGKVSEVFTGRKDDGKDSHEIAQGGTDTKDVTSAETITFDKDSEASEESESSQQQPSVQTPVEPGNYNVAVLLPFMLEEAGITEQTRLNDDFFKGFLLAADTLSHQGQTIDIQVYDTRNDLTTLRGVMGKTEMGKADVLIAPGDAQQMELILEMAPQGSYVLNPFLIKDKSYITNPKSVQLNLPSESMYELASDAVLDLFDGYQPVILENLKGKSEKTEFVDYLTDRFTEESITPARLSYENRLTSERLTEFVDSLGTAKQIVFIPLSGSLSEFNTFSHAIKSVRDNAMNPSDISLFGYPDWTAFRGDAEEMLHKLNATVYSRFFYDANSEGTTGVASAFRRWYGDKMIETVPNQAILGFDIGKYVIDNMRRNNGRFVPAGNPFEGIQSSFDLVKPEDAGGNSGYVNNAIYIIRFDDFANTITRLR